jgi:hypothetical protein
MSRKRPDEAMSESVQQTSLKVLLSRGQRKALAELLPEFADRLLLDAKNPRKISFNRSELETIQQQARDAIPNAPSGIQRNFLKHVLRETSRALEESQGIGSIPASVRLYQFKITLVDSDPSIWRRIQVRNCTLNKLHERIQTAMGWTNSHLHQFKIDDECYGDPELLDEGFEDDDECIDSTQIAISEIVPRSGRRFRFWYEYDFGDGWEHEVLFEGCLSAVKGHRYPICVEGERACPPEDVGGVWGYFDFLKAIADPEHEQHQECLTWAGSFDPEEFDAGKATKAMRRGLPDWRRYR